MPGLRSATPRDEARSHRRAARPRGPLPRPLATAQRRLLSSAPQSRSAPAILDGGRERHLPTRTRFVAGAPLGRGRSSFHRSSTLSSGCRPRSLPARWWTPCAPARQEPHRHSSRPHFVVTNTQDVAVRVVVEPWGDFQTVQPGDSVGVLCSGHEAGHINVRLGLSQLEFWAEGNRDLELRLDRSGAPAAES
jgi:hypothetical protein